MRFIGIGVYGSCGRLEMRSHSDVEFSVYFEGEPNEQIMSRALSLWNRLAIYLREKGYKHEWQEKLIRNQWDLLPIEEIQDLELRNDGYRPVISLDELRSGNWNELRNRYFQFITEMRPIFNKELLDDIRQQLLYRNTNYTRSYCNKIDDVKRSTSLADAVKLSVIMAITDSFLLDLKPDRMESADDLKKITFRVLNVLCLRLMICKYCMNSIEEKELNNFYDIFPKKLIQPGIYKIVAFAIWFKDRPAKNKEHFSRHQEIIKILEKIIDGHAISYRIMENLTASTPIELKKIFIDDVAPVVKNYKNVLSLLKSEFPTLYDKFSWIFACDLLDEIKI